MIKFKWRASSQDPMGVIRIWSLWSWVVLASVVPVQSVIHKAAAHGAFRSSGLGPRNASVRARRAHPPSVSFSTTSSSAVGRFRSSVDLSRGTCEPLFAQAQWGRRLSEAPEGNSDFIEGLTAALMKALFYRSGIQSVLFAGSTS